MSYQTALSARPTQPPSWTVCGPFSPSIYNIRHPSCMPRHRETARHLAGDGRQSRDLTSMSRLHDSEGGPDGQEEAETGAAAP